MTRIIATTLSVALISAALASPASAGRAERSAENHAKAESWCNAYLAENPGARCNVMRMGRLCPSGMTAGKRFNSWRANGYKTCVEGRKIATSFKKAHNIKILVDRIEEKKNPRPTGAVRELAD